MTARSAAAREFTAVEEAIDRVAHRLLDGRGRSRPLAVASRGDRARRLRAQARSASCGWWRSSMSPARWVSATKIVSWFQLCILSVVLVTLVHRPRQPIADTPPPIHDRAGGG